MELVPLELLDLQQRHVVAVLAWRSLLAFLEVGLHAAEDELAEVRDGLNHEGTMIPLSRPSSVVLDFVELELLRVDQNDVGEADFVVPASLQQDGDSIVHHVGGVTATFRELGFLVFEFLLLLGFAVEDPDVIEELACKERASVSADELDLPVEVGGGVASAGTGPLDHGHLVVLRDAVQRFLLLECEFPVEV